MEGHAVRHGRAVVEFLVSHAGHEFDHAPSFVQVVDDRRGRHAQDVQDGVAFAGVTDERCTSSRRLETFSPRRLA